MRISSGHLLACASLLCVGCAEATESPTEALPHSLTEAQVGRAARPARQRPLLTSVAQHEAPSTPGPASCAAGMLLVEGQYCPRVEQKCLRYLEHRGRYRKFRCAEYAEPRCLSKHTQSLRFCIDRDEYTEPNQRLPANHKTFLDGQRICESEGKRLCKESEWNFACEGEEMRAYPYGSKRDPNACNADRTDILTPGRALKDLRAPSDAFPECKSPFGVRNLTGNLEEFVVKDGTKPRPIMKGAYWQPSRNACRDRQTVHGERYQGTETGFRCCAEAKPE